MPFLTIKKAPNSSKKAVSVIVGLRVAKKAVKRNLIRRQIKAIMNPIANTMKRKFVVIVNPEAKNASFESLKSEINQLTKNRPVP